MIKYTLTIMIVFYFFLGPCSAADGYLINKIMSVNPGEMKSLKIETQNDVSINIAFTDMSYHETMKCGKCLHLAHRVENGQIMQINSSNYGVGFIKVTPENGIIEIIINHDFIKPKNIEIQVREFKPAR